MSFGTFSYPMPANEPVLQYAPGSKERDALQKALAELKKKKPTFRNTLAAVRYAVAISIPFIRRMNATMCWATTMPVPKRMFSKLLMLR